MHRCLFLDDAHIAHIRGLTRRAHPAKRHPANPLLTKAHPWEHMRFQLYGRCVVYNPQRKRYQLFYIAQPAAVPKSAMRRCPPTPRATTASTGTGHCVQT